jgi:glycosyltransferase involved in cell wall biosynthesis
MPDATPEPIRSEQPIVSIGMPVYNGGDYLRAAIESVIDQKFNNWELIISDNASTDGTEAVCREFAAQDERISYIRQTENLGAGPNFKACFEPARGKFFAWLSADDLLGQEFMLKCVELLDENDDAVAAYTHAMKIDATGNELGIYDAAESVHNRASHVRAHRYKELLLGYPAVIIFSMMRRELLATTPVMSSNVGGDRILVSEMGLHGRFLQVPDVQFYRRVHEDQYSWKATTAEERRVWFGGANAKGGFLTEFRRFGDHVESFRRVDMPRSERGKCRRILLSSFGFHMLKSQVGLSLRNLTLKLGKLTGKDLDLYRWMQRNQQSN